MPGGVAAEGTARIISRLSGTCVSAKGLLNTKLIGKGAPRCYVKGIKGNSHLVDLFCTEPGEGNNPQWDEPWSYDCLKTRSREEFVGLKFLVCDGDDFLGGADFDLSQLSAYKEAVEEMELMGLVFGKVKGVQPRKARLFITCCVERRFMPIFPPPQTSLMASLRGIARVASICGRIVRAKELRNPRPKKGLSNKRRSWPMCYVRCYMMSGKILTVHTTRAVNNIAHPDWDEIFTFDFDDQSDQPIMLMFDIRGTASLPAAQVREIWKDGDVLGSCMLIVDSLKDEAAYAKGEGRMRLPILGDFQQIENRLEKDTAKEAKVKEDEVGPQSSWKQKMDAIANISTAFGFGAKRTKAVADSFLTVQLFAERENLPMPHCKLMDEPVVVEQMELDVKPDAELQTYFGKVDEYGESVKRLEITARERVVTIYGRVQAATDLIAADITGKSDPYVIVEALTKTGELLFVFRTRVIPSNLNPTWGEAFFWRVPPDPDDPLLPVVLSKLTFSVYDSDEGQIMEMVGGGDDDFLGRCGVDISTMRNNDTIAEDIPLLGVKARPGGFKSGGGFRRYSTISVEIMVERRVHRMIDMQHHYDPELLLVPKYSLSRPMLTGPGVKPYKDLSQEVTESKQEGFANTAKKVLSLRDSNKLAKFSNPARWKEICQTEGQGWQKTRPVTSPFVPVTSPPPVLPYSRRKSQDREADENNVPQSDVPDHRRNWVALRENWNEKLIGAQASSTLNYESLNLVNRLPPMGRTNSAPIILGTRFGQNYAKMTSNPFEDPIKKALKHIPPRMLPAGTGSEVATTKLTSKPALELYSTRVRDVHTAPARLSGPL